MNSPALRYAVVSADEVFRARARRVVGSLAAGLDLVADVPVAFSSLHAAGTKELDSRRPRLLLVDLEPDPAAGVVALRAFSELDPTRTFLLTGPAIPPNLLLDAMRAGAMEYLQKPVTDEDLAGAFLRAARKLGGGPADEARPPGRVLTFFGAKGGSGVTTAAVNTAVWLQRATRMPTLLLDLDLDLGSSALLLGIRPRYSFVDMVHNLHRMDEGLLASYVGRHESGLHLLAPPAKLDLSHSISREQIAALLEFLRRYYAYVVIDLPRRVSPAVSMVFANSDQIFLIATPDLPAIQNLKRLLPVLPRLTGDRTDHLRIVLNRYQAEQDSVSPKDVEEILELPVFCTLAEDALAVTHCANLGRPVVLNGSSRFARDLKALSGHLHDEKREERSTRGGFLHALLRRLRRGRPGRVAPPGVAAKGPEAR